jgi:hypothetical protein
MASKLRKALDKFERNFMKNVPFAKESKQLAQAYLGIREDKTEELRAQIKADQDEQFLRMRRAAERAGFNPLTVLRQTGGRGFEMPIMSKEGAFGKWEPVVDFFKNKEIDKYNKEIRELELEQRQTTLAIDKMQLDQLVKPKRSKMTANSIKVANAKDIKVSTSTVGKITSQPLVPGTGKTLDEIFAQQPVDNRVMKTGDGSYTNDIMSAALYPLVTPGGNVVYVPWNPEDADFGALVGGTAQYGALKAYDKYKDFSIDNMLNKIDPMSENEIQLRQQLDRLN